MKKLVVLLLMVASIAITNAGFVLIQTGSLSYSTSYMPIIIDGLQFKRYYNTIEVRQPNGELITTLYNTDSDANVSRWYLGGYPVKRIGGTYRYNNNQYDYLFFIYNSAFNGVYLGGMIYDSINITGHILTISLSSDNGLTMGWKNGIVYARGDSQGSGLCLYGAGILTGCNMPSDVQYLSYYNELSSYTGWFSKIMNWVSYWPLGVNNEYHYLISNQGYIIYTGTSNTWLARNIGTGGLWAFSSIVADDIKLFTLNINQQTGDIMTTSSGDIIITPNYYHIPYNGNISYATPISDLQLTGDMCNITSSNDGTYIYTICYIYDTQQGITQTYQLLSTDGLSEITAGDIIYNNVNDTTDTTSTDSSWLIPDSITNVFASIGSLIVDAIQKPMENIDNLEEILNSANYSGTCEVSTGDSNNVMISALAHKDNDFVELFKNILFVLAVIGTIYILFVNN